MDKSMKVRLVVIAVVTVVGILVAAALYMIPYIYNLSDAVEFEVSDKIYENPLTGYAPNAAETERAERAQLVYIELTWADWEPEEGKFDIKGLEEKNNISRWKDEGKHAVLRFICDIPGAEEHMDIPEWLYDKTADGSFYDTDYGKGYSPDYENKIFLESHEKAMAALGEYCNRDMFVSFVELGSVGHWGEWHTKYEDGVTPMPDADTCWLYANHYADNFTNARLMMRRNYVMAVDGQMGLYNDMTGAKDDTEEWIAWMKDGGAYDAPGTQIPYKPAPDIWRYAPIGGEFTSSIPMEEMLGEDLEETLELIKRSHMTFIGPKCPKGELSASEASEEILRNIGYRFYIKKMSIHMDYLKNSFKVNLTWENDGAAPMYFDWPVMLYVYDGDGNRKYWEDINISLDKLYPGESLETANEFPFNDLFRQGYSIGIGILDPQTEEPGVELAMNKKYENGINMIYMYDGNTGSIFQE